MALIQSWFDFVYRLYAKSKGTATVSRHYVTSDLGDLLTGYSVSGYEIRLYCQENRYVREHLCWFFPTQTYSTFRVFVTVSADAPEVLRKACELDIDLPRLLPPFLSTALQKQAAIQAYLDILSVRVTRETGACAPLG